MYYPIMLDIRGRKAVVAGGGQVACRKIKALIAAGAAVTVVSVHGSEQLKKWSETGQIHWLRRAWKIDDAETAFLVFAATDDREANKQIAEQTQSNQLVSIIDRYEEGNFVLPAVCHRGRLTLAVSTGGASPLLARRIRDEAAARLDDQTEDYLEFLFQMRQEIKRKVTRPADKTLCLRNLLDRKYREKQIQEQTLHHIDAFITESLCQ
ncbi:bifunctional precorrin-2 dehydrogenase/sirohydrochlorin ferrochelatase [Sporolactobacillus terrae]|uniref:precorrin-2 dehydrogenase/sirohydrochlorin ferrochelatase family protein n=1 Tax=Sporolactobacillus terrae TaxID=269673 RepID=UPI00048DFF74|nr:NAD(P)-dependent oxidoreductase [Sporolactobacillus terrae]